MDLGEKYMEVVQRHNYKFLHLLVLFEANHPIEQRMRKAGLEPENYSKEFIEDLKEILANPTTQSIKRLRQVLYPHLKFPEPKPPPSRRKYSRIPFNKRNRQRLLPTRKKLKPEKPKVEVKVETPPKKKLSSLPRRPYVPIVSEEEKKAVEMEIINLRFAIATSEVRRLKALQKQFDHYLPGRSAYDERYANPKYEDLLFSFEDVPVKKISKINPQVAKSKLSKQHLGGISDPSFHRSRGKLQ